MTAPFALYYLPVLSAAMQGPPGAGGLTSQPIVVAPTVTPVQATAFFVTPVDARSGIAQIQTPLNPTTDQVFAVQDIYGVFTVNPCQLLSQGSGIKTWDDSSGSYLTNAAIRGLGGAARYYFAFYPSLNLWCPA